MFVYSTMQYITFESLVLPTLVTFLNIANSGGQVNHFSASLILLQFLIFTCLDTNIKYTNYLLHNLNGSRNKLSSIFFLQHNAARWAHIFATTMQILV